MAGKWRLVDAEFQDPHLNIALEEAILEALKENSAAPNTVRLWQNPKAVVVGCFQSVSSEADVRLCRKLGIPIVRRCSGGGAVYHDLNNLNWSLFMKLKDDPSARGSVMDLFILAGRCIIQGLRHLDVEAAFRPPNTIALAGRKISGMAMCIRKSVALCHGTLLVAADLQVLRSVLQPLSAGFAGKTFTRSRREEVTSLEKVLGNPLPMARVKEALTKGIEETLDITVKKDCLTVWEKETLERFYREKYSRSSWNFSIR